MNEKKEKNESIRNTAKTEQNKPKRTYNRKPKTENPKQKSNNRKNKRAGKRHCTEDRLAFYDSLSQPGSTAAAVASYDRAQKISRK